MLAKCFGPPEISSEVEKASPLSYDDSLRFILERYELYRKYLFQRFGLIDYSLDISSNEGFWPDGQINGYDSSYL